MLVDELVDKGHTLDRVKKHLMKVLEVSPKPLPNNVHKRPLSHIDVSRAMGAIIKAPRVYFSAQSISYSAAHQRACQPIATFGWGQVPASDITTCVAFSKRIPDRPPKLEADICGIRDLPNIWLVGLVPALRPTV